MRPRVWGPGVAEFTEMGRGGGAGLGEGRSSPNLPLATKIILSERYLGEQVWEGCSDIPSCWKEEIKPPYGRHPPRPRRKGTFLSGNGSEALCKQAVST